MAASSKRVIYAAMLGNFGIAVIKFFAAMMTGSAAMLSEGIHSLVDTGNQVLLLFGLKQSRKPASEDFPFGHGKEIYFWSFNVAILIFAVGAGVSIYEGVHSLLHRNDPHSDVNYHVNYIVLAVAMVLEGIAWGLALKAFRKEKGDSGYFEAVHRGKDPTTFVVLFEDSAAMLGLFVAFIGIFLQQMTGNSLYDSIASIIIGLLLGATSAWLAYETKSLLIGESANRKVVQGIRKIVASVTQVNHVNEVLTVHMGPEYILVNLSVDFKDASKTKDIERTIATLDNRIKAAYPEVKRIFIEAEARLPRRSTASAVDTAALSES